MAFFNASAQLEKQRFYPLAAPWYFNNNDTSFLGFSGGFHAPYLTQIDLDGDGRGELLVKDAFSDREWVFKYVTVGDKSFWIPATHLEEKLPHMQSFFTALDINNDGLKDLITGDDKFLVYTNESDFNIQFNESPKTLNYNFEGEWLPIEFQVGETPCIADVDGDGKHDVLVFDNNGERVVFYKNISSQNNDFQFEIETENWGFFREEGLNFEIILGSNKRGHPGSKILAFDHDDDGDMDLLLSDITTSVAFFLENGKADLALEHDSMISLSKAYPLNGNEIDIPYFPSFSLVDADLDGDQDLICANSSRSPVVNGGVWLYENGSGKGFDLTLKSKSFLQENGIDLGIISAPTTFDADADGDLDLLIAGINHLNNDIFQEQFGYFEFYENIGSQKKPLYELADNDYLNFFEKKYRSLAPAFGDIDNDGDQDLLIGKANGEVVFLENTGGANNAFVFSSTETTIANIDVGSDATPLVYDIDGDNINDLIIGELGGNLNYYKGKGNLEFTLQTENWGGVKTNTFYWQPVKDDDGNVIDSTKQYLSVGGSYPTMVDVDQNGLPDLLVGSTWGKMYYYPDIDLTKTYFRQSAVWYHNPHLIENFDKDLGSNTKPHFADLDNNGFYELLIGNFNGGVELFTAKSVVVSNSEIEVEETGFTVFPNPSNGIVNIKNNQNFQVTYNVFNLNGKEIKYFTAMPYATKTFSLEKGVFIIKANQDFFKLIVY